MKKDESKLNNVTYSAVCPQCVAIRLTTGHTPRSSTVMAEVIRV